MIREDSHDRKGPIPRTSVADPGWLERVEEALRYVGCAVVNGVLGDELLTEVSAALHRALAAVTAEVGAERLRRAGELGVVRLPMRFEDVFYRLLDLGPVLAVVDRTVSPTAVLHTQNGFLLPPAKPPAADVFQLKFHMDFPRVLGGYLCSINTLLAIDDFTRDNGGTLVVPGTQQAVAPPSTGHLERHALAAECPAGSMLVFDSTLWHAAGRNQSARERLAVNQQFTRSYFKQQIDYVRALGEEAVTAQPSRVQQLLGWYTRVPASLDDYYRPREERLYRAGQG